MKLKNDILFQTKSISYDTAYAAPIRRNVAEGSRTAATTALGADMPF